MKSSLLKLTLLLAVLTIALTACGRVLPDNRTDTNIAADEITLEIWSISPVSRLAPIFRESNPNITVNARLFYDMRLYERELPLALAAGTAPNLFFMHDLDHRDPAINYYFADWFPIMQADFYFNENDYFVNVFHALTFEGRLYAFPTTFNFGMVAANTLVPGLVNDLSQTAGVTPDDLIEFTRHSGHFVYDHLLYVHQRFTMTGWHGLLGGGWIHNFIDMDTRTADFNNQAFVDAITFAKELTNPQPFRWASDLVNIVTSRQESEFSQMYMFYHYFPSIPQYFMPIDNLLFEGRTPLVNRRGELVINPWMIYGISAASSPEQRQAAWDFMRLMQDPEMADLASLMIPVGVSTYKPRMRHEFAMRVPNEAVFAENNWQFSGTREYLILDGIAELTRIASMPMAEVGIIPETIFDIVREAIEEFESGYITAWDAAETLQDRVTLALREMD